MKHIALLAALVIGIGLVPARGADLSLPPSPGPVSPVERDFILGMAKAAESEVQTKAKALLVPSLMRVALLFERLVDATLAIRIAEREQLRVIGFRVNAAGFSAGYQLRPGEDVRQALDRFHAQTVGFLESGARDMSEQAGKSSEDEAVRSAFLRQSDAMRSQWLLLSSVDNGISALEVEGPAERINTFGDDNLKVVMKVMLGNSGRTMPLPSVEHVRALSSELRAVKEQHR